MSAWKQIRSALKQQRVEHKEWRDKQRRALKNQKRRKSRNKNLEKWRRIEGDVARDVQHMVCSPLASDDEADKPWTRKPTKTPILPGHPKPPFRELHVPPPPQPGPQHIIKDAYFHLKNPSFGGFTQMEGITTRII